MLDRVIGQIALALFAWLEKRMERGHRATDSDVDRDSLRRAGSAVREWMQSNGSRSGGKSSPSGAKRDDEGVRPD